MSETIRPALTAEEWAAGHTTNAEGVPGVRLSKILERPIKSYDDFRVLDIGQLDWIGGEPTAPVTSRDQCDCLSTRRRDFYYGEVYEGRERHGVAALALHGQPFGFTREDVRALRWEIEHIQIQPSRDFSPTHCELRRVLLNTIADRIEALLPPESQP